MFNVLPENLKKLFIHEYYVRVAIVCCMLIVVLQVVTLFFLFPSWLDSTYKQQDIEQQVAHIQTIPKTTPGSTISDTIKSTNMLLGILNTTMAYPSVKTSLDATLSRAVSSVQLLDFSYIDTDATHAIISLKGVSATRTALVSFVKSLQESGVFAVVTLPVSDLAKDTNIAFELQMTIGKTQ